jgi:hypothetical protein
MVQDEQFLFQFGKWFEISDGQAFLVRKMVQIERSFLNENGSMDCRCTIDNDSPCGQCGGMV